MDSDKYPTARPAAIEPGSSSAEIRNWICFTLRDCDSQLTHDEALEMANRVPGNGIIFLAYGQGELQEKLGNDVYGEMLYRLLIHRNKNTAWTWFRFILGVLVAVLAFYAVRHAFNEWELEFNGLTIITLLFNVMTITFSIGTTYILSHRPYSTATIENSESFPDFSMSHAQSVRGLDRYSPPLEKDPIKTAD